MSENIPLTDHQKDTIRAGLVAVGLTLVGIPYDKEDGVQKWTGRGKWLDLTKLPASLDCSGLTTGVYQKNGLKLVNGAQFQFNETMAIPKENKKPGDLAFFGHDRDITKIYHVGMVYDDKFILEAREYDGRDWTGKVLLREIPYWENWKNFVGYRAHTKLA